MSNHCHSEHEAHSHGHGHGHGGHDHSHDAAPIPTTNSQSINSKILTTHLTALNLDNSTSDLPLLFKSNDNRYSISPEFKSDADCQLILKIPFTGSIKLYSIILRTNGDSNHCPKTIKLYKNLDNLDFDNISSAKPTFTIEHPQVGVLDTSNDELIEDDTFVEHFVPRASFTGMNNLTVFFETNWEDDEDEIIKLYSVELRGEFKELSKDPVITLYESAANPADHKNLLASENKNFSGLD